MINRRKILTQMGQTAAATATTVGTASLFQGNAAWGQTSGRWRVPEESEPHELTFMQWPVSRMVHPDAWFLEGLQDAIARTANAIADFEPVIMLAGAEHHRDARGKLSINVELLNIPTEDLWARDSGPLFVTDGNGKLAVQNLNFNGWGGKQVHRHDGQVSRRVARFLDVEHMETGLVGEPGGVEFDGHGTLMAHASSWANPNRNQISQDEIGERLMAAYGASKIIWAPGIKDQDITDDHIDSFARFVEPGRVLVQMPSEFAPNDAWRRRANETLNILQSATDAQGRRLDITIINDPWDTNVTSDSFVAAYVNYYVCNGAVIMAAFGDTEADSQARQSIARLYPGREVVTLNVDEIGEVGGGIHCATQQLPVV